MSKASVVVRAAGADRAIAACLSACVSVALFGCIPDLGADIAPLASEPDGGTGASDASPVQDASALPDSAMPPRDAGPPTDGGDLLAQGDYIFHVNAGGVTGGCASCHGQEGRGDVGIGPNIRGRSRDDIVWALRNVDLMQRVHLTTAQIDAVAAYVASLVP